MLTLASATHGRHPATWTPGTGHVLIAGTTLAGKSSWINSAVAAAAARPDVQLIGFDLKRVELAPWAPRLSALARTPGQAAELIARAVDLLDTRIVLADARGWRSWPPSISRPWILIPVDELAEVAEVDGVLEALLHIGQVGRAFGFGLIGATQQASAKVFGDTRLRGLFTRRAALFDPERVAYSMILGQAGVKEHASLLANLSMSRPGLAVWVDTAVSDLPWLARPAYWSDEDVARQAAATAHLTIPLAELTARQTIAAIGEVA